MTRYSSGDLAQIRRQQDQQCNAEVRAYEDDQRRRKLAAEDAERRQRQAAADAERRQRQAYEDAQRQYEADQRRYNELQRQKQSALNQQQIESQRQLQASLQQQQQQLQQLQQSSSQRTAVQPVTEPPRSTTFIGTVIQDTKRTYDGSVRAKEQVKTTVDAINAIFSSGEIKNDAQRSLISTAAAQMPSFSDYGELVTPKRNDSEDKDFRTLFSSAKALTLDNVPRAPLVVAIQDTAMGSVQSNMQQTLGDINQLQQQIMTFGSTPNGS